MENRLQVQMSRALLLKVYDDLGRSIVKSYATAKRETISVQTFASGLVHIVVSRDGQYFVEKIVLE